jgi:hypothetical protein
MGMSIDKTIEFFNGLECHTPQAKDAKDVAIDTMRKYQKIKHIISKWDAGIYDDEGLCDAEVLEMISMIIDEVIEDGKTD